MASRNKDGDDKERLLASSPAPDEPPPKYDRANPSLYPPPFLASVVRGHFPLMAMQIER